MAGAEDAEGREENARRAMLALLVSSPLEV